MLKYVPLIATLALSSSLTYGALWPTQAEDLGESQDREAQRALYRSALAALGQGRRRDFRSALDQLGDYPLTPYLVYFDYRARLSSLSGAEVAAFRDAHPDLPAGDRLLTAWLYRRGTNREWRDFLAHYPPRAPDTELQCLYLRALHATGRADEALEAVEPLWVVARSQPRVCDPLFEVWLKSPHLTQATVWRRLNLALAANERVLARYLSRFFKGEYLTWGKALYDVHVNPTQVLDHDRYAPDSELSRTVIAHGLRRLATTDAPLASRAFERYRGSHVFSPAEANYLAEYLLVAKALQGTFPDASIPLDLEMSTVAAIADAAVKRAMWHEVVAWTGLLDASERGRDQWRYWRARALEEIAEGDQLTEEARAAYADLADDRSYYGFLAAARLGQAPVLNAVTATIDRERMREFRLRAEVARSEELIATGDTTNLRREWLSLTARLDPQAGVLWTYLLAARGQAPMAISTANTFDLRDHVAVRFPILYSDLFSETAGKTGVPVSRLMSLARQESAFDATAVSSANARGLIQMLHSTAVLAARRAGHPAPSIADLSNPRINIRLAAHHIAWLLKRYHGVFPVAAAAYNAGEHRVDRWIGAARGMPMDVWIETIPFAETRNYVKNVLAFNQVYAMLLDESLPILDDHEERLR